MCNNENDIRVSVVIPAYNAEACVGRAIDSALGQSLPVYEVIIVDDGSTDRTGEVVKEYGSNVIYIKQENAGVSVARNRGIKAAKGNWIAFLDADDQWLEQKNARQIEVIKQNPDLKWCAANYFKAVGKTLKTLGNQKKIEQYLKNKSCFDNYFEATIDDICHAHTQTMMIRRDIFDIVGFFEPGKQRFEDLDIWWKIGYRYPKIGYIAEPLTVMHLEEHDSKLVKLRLNEKRGVDARILIARHLLIAKDFHMEDLFCKFAAKYLKKRLRTMLFNGFGEDARGTVREFRELMVFWIRWGVYLLTVFPRTTSAVMRGFSWMKHSLKINREVTRRYSQTEIDKHFKK